MAEIFEECSKYTLDGFWIEQFQNFAQNKFPQGVRYDHAQNALILKIDGKKDVIELSQNPEKTFQIVMSILKNKLNLRSTRDLKLQKSEINKLIEQRVCDTNCEWAKIKPKNLRDQLIMNYITYLKNKYSLNPMELRRLIALINMGFKFKYISQNDVVYKNGKILKIECLQINKKTKEFKIPYNPVASKATKQKKTCNNEFYSEMSKYINLNTKRRNKYY